MPEASGCNDRIPYLFRVKVVIKELRPGLIMPIGVWNNPRGKEHFVEGSFDILDAETAIRMDVHFESFQVLVKADNTRSKEEVSMTDISTEEWNKFEDVMRIEWE